MQPALEPQYDVLLRELDKLHKSLQEQAAGYTRVIFGIGYAGFFAVWSGIKLYLGRKEAILSALLLLVSVVAYLCFEVFQAAFLSITALRIGTAAQKGAAELDAELTKFNKKHKRLWTAYRNFWYCVFPLCVLTGFGGAAILVKAFVRNLFS
jgi:hypothetical protein